MSRTSPVHVLLRSEQTGGALGVVRGETSAGWPGPPIHHHDFDETFYVLSGELTFEVAGSRVTARAGDLAFAPRGVVHGYANLSDAPASCLLVVTPGGFERYFDRLAAEIEGREPPPEAAKGYPEVTVVGPPVGDRG